MDKIFKNPFARTFGMVLCFAINADAQLEQLTTPRDWTIDGDKLSAFYLSSTDKQVKLRVDGTQEIRTISLKELSTEDLRFIHQLQLGGQLPILEPQRFVGKVVQVADGDSFVVLMDGHRVEIRMHGIDAPDHGQPFNQQAGKALRSLIQNQVVQLEQIDTDKYDRKVCRVYRGRVNLNAKAVELGYAWHYKAFSDDPRLAELQRQAQRQQRGLWALPNPVPPWEWRRLHPREAAR